MHSAVRESLVRGDRKTATGRTKTKKKKQVIFGHGAGEGAYDVDARLAADLQNRLVPNYKVHCARMPNDLSEVAADIRRLG
jgi:hypothetical protein